MSLASHLYSSAQVRDFDKRVIADFGFTGTGLMHSAGTRAFEIIVKYYNNLKPWVILCGSGNNGGDGYVVAECARAAGIEVRVIQSAMPKTEDAIYFCNQFLANNGNVLFQNLQGLNNSGLIIDALFGTGLNRAPTGFSAELIELANKCPCPLVALDLPSGLNSDTGFAYDPCIDARMSITFIAKKLGMHTAVGKNKCGYIIYEGLDLPLELFTGTKPMASFIPQPNFPHRKPDSHKGQYGDVVIAGGDNGMLGATLLAGRAALRSGSGLVTVLSTEQHLDSPALHCPELMSQCMENKSNFEALCKRCDVIALGPGLGQSPWSLKLFEGLKESPGPLVVDADGLNHLAKTPFKRENWILTPHPGEAASLLNCDIKDIQKDRLGAVQKICEQYGGVCVLKGAGTLVASESGDVYVSDGGNPGMATAGMGDVLTGIIASLVGQGMSNLDAAMSGVWLHSKCGDNVATILGMRALMAGDVIDELPAVLKSLE